MFLFLALLSVAVGKTTGASVTEECVDSGAATAQVACPLLHRKSESKLRRTLLTRHTMDMFVKKIFLQAGIKFQNRPFRWCGQFLNFEAASI